MQKLMLRAMSSDFAKQPQDMLQDVDRTLAMTTHDYDELGLSSVLFLKALSLKSLQRDNEAIEEYAMGCHCEAQEAYYQGKATAAGSDLTRMTHRIFQGRVRLFSACFRCTMNPLTCIAPSWGG